MKIKKGDKVIVIAGKDKGKTGSVAKTSAKLDRVVIDGVNVVTKHQKDKRLRSQGQIIKKPLPIHVSNVALAVDGKPVRVGYKIDEKGKKIRIVKSSGQAI